jgi:SAM-dependent methyltransferase
MSTDADWRAWGRTDPYYGVITHPKYRTVRLNAESLGEFFRSGENEVREILRTIRTHIDRGFTPKTAVDFGCGVGRLLVGLSRTADVVVGLDVSDGMLAEAEKNCRNQGVKNVVLQKSDDDLSQLTGTFELIVSVIVFQHIPPARGVPLFKKLLERLGPGGVGAIHITYAKEQQDAAPLRIVVRGVKAIARRIGRKLIGLVRYRDPEMQMNLYPLNELLLHIQRAGVRRMYSELTDHGGYYGVHLFFQKPKSG